MTFDFALAMRAAGHFAMRNYNPSPIPAIWGATWYPPGFAVSFLNATDIDTSHSLNYVMETGGGRSFVCPSRTQGNTLLDENFNSLGNWASICNGTGTYSSVTITGQNDPAIDGPALDLNTGGTIGSTAGVMAVLPATPDNFSFMAVPRLAQVGTDPANALHIWVSNNQGKCLRVRFYEEMIETWINGAWQLLLAHGGNYFWEPWVNVVDNHDGTHTITCLAGTQICNTITGVIAGDGMPANRVKISLGSANVYRNAQVAQITVGPTQLPDSMVYCSPRVTTLRSPVTGYAMLLCDDVSLSVVPGVNLKLSITKGDTTPWIEVPLTDHGVWGNGEIDNTKPIRMFAGSIPFDTGGGCALRANVATFNGVFPVLQGLTMFWD